MRFHNGDKQLTPCGKQTLRNRELRNYSAQTLDVGLYNGLPCICSVLLWWSHTFEEKRTCFHKNKNPKRQKIFLVEKGNVYLIWPFNLMAGFRWKHSLYSCPYSSEFISKSVNYYFIVPQKCVYINIAVYAESESSRISLQISSFVFWRSTKVLWVWSDMRVSN